MADSTPKWFADFFSEVTAGIDSNTAPQLLKKNQLAYAQNVSLRGGFCNSRPPFQIQTLNFNGNSKLQNLVLTGLFQGAGYYRPDAGVECLMAQISGHLLLFTPAGGSWTVTDVSVPGSLNSATATQVWMWQSEKWMIINDGTGALPIFFDGVSSRRSAASAVLLGTTAAPYSPPVIGSQVTLTLAAPYTGSYAVAVILNGEFYQTVSASTQNYVSLLNLNDTAGNIYPGSTNLTSNPLAIGEMMESFNYNPNGLTVGSVIKNVPISNAYTGAVGGMIYLNNTGLPFTVTAIGGPGTNSSYPLYPTISIKWTGAETLYNTISGFFYFTSTSQPSVVVGVTQAQFTAPTAGVAVQVPVAQSYSGQPGALVQIGSAFYQITAANVSQAGSTSLTVQNMTDETTQQVAAGATIYSVPELPPGRMGAYGLGVNSFCLTDGISYLIGDVVGAASGSSNYNYRDAVLKTVEATFLPGGGFFSLPGAGNQITAMAFTVVLDTSLGQGALQIATATNIFSNTLPGTNPAGWNSLTSPFVVPSLEGRGALGQNSTVQINSDTFFRSYDGLGSLVLARREFYDWGNKPISTELTRILKNDNAALLSYGSASYFDNRYYSTANPYSGIGGVSHAGMTTLNFDLLNSLRAQNPPSWEGVWTGLNVLQIIEGQFSGTNRQLVFSYNFNSSQIELYEVLPESTAQYADNGATPVKWEFETAVLFNGDVKPLNVLAQLKDGEVYLSGILGTVHVEVYFRPDYYPCWTLWNKFDVSQGQTLANAQPGYRTRIGLGEPSPNAVEIANNRPLRNGYFFQFRFIITGCCTVNGMRASAVEVPQAAYAPLIQPGNNAPQEIDCTPPDDWTQYIMLQGAPPGS